MSDSHLYYTVHWCWNILFSICPSAGTMAVLCLQGWLAGLPWSQDTWTWRSLASPNVPRPQLLLARLWVGKPRQSVQNFCGGFRQCGSTPQFPYMENLAVWAGGEPRHALTHNLGVGLEASKLLPVGLAVLQKFLRLVWGSLQTPQESQTVREPKVSFLNKHWHGMVLILLTSRDQGMLVLNVTVTHS